MEKGSFINDVMNPRVGILWVVVVPVHKPSSQKFEIAKVARSKKSNLKIIYVLESYTRNIWVSKNHKVWRH